MRKETVHRDRDPSYTSRRPQAETEGHKYETIGTGEIIWEQVIRFLSLTRVTPGCSAEDQSYWTHRQRTQVRQPNSSGGCRADGNEQRR